MAQAFSPNPVKNHDYDAKTPVNPGDAGMIPVDSKRGNDSKILADPPTYAPPTYAPPAQSANRQPRRAHTNAVIQAGHVRARDEVRLLQSQIRL